ncbi:hypothetical protein RJ640_030223, partial [Escallonia rubra]
MSSSIAYPNHLLLFVLLVTILIRVLSFNVEEKSTLLYPLSCSNQSQKCKSHLYHISRGLQLEEVASFYSVNTSRIEPIYHGNKQDCLVSVPCTCKDVNGTQSYFYDTFYSVQPGDTFENISNVYYSGQTLMINGEAELFVAGNRAIIHLVCGCVEAESIEVVTYTVQAADTVSAISELLSADVSGVENLNGRLKEDPNYIDVGWVLFVPMGKRGLQAPKKRYLHIRAVIICILSAVTLFAVVALIHYFLRRNQAQGTSEEDPKAVNTNPNTKKLTLLNQFLKKDIEGSDKTDMTFNIVTPHLKSKREPSSFRVHLLDTEVTRIESEKPITYSLEEIDAATSNFDKAKEIGRGACGSVYLGILRGQEVAIKKMKSTNLKEFFMELKVLCKIHHINVVELLGYASGDNHLYLVYEYVPNGSLDDHLHEPYLKGNQPLSWTARAHIAIDTARGIEYIHDHTKTRYVHRDIKTSNILLDQELRAKVADFGLAKLVERSNENDYIATQVVGTPGYLPPESLRELQTTSKTDIFAFGVVLAELITGHRAIIADTREPTKLKSLSSLMYAVFCNTDSEAALEATIDGNLKGSYPADEVYK